MRFYTTESMTAHVYESNHYFLINIDITHYPVLYYHFHCRLLFTQTFGMHVWNLDLFFLMSKFRNNWLTYTHCFLLDYDAMYFGRWFLAFWKISQPQSWGYINLEDQGSMFFCSIGNDLSGCGVLTQKTTKWIWNPQISFLHTLASSIFRTVFHLSTAKLL